MSVQDYRINAEVRRHLVSRWVDVSVLRIGTTNGVVYVMGRLDTSLDDPVRRQRQAHDESLNRILRLVIQIEREIRRLRDVRDVVFKLDNASKRGGRWRIIEQGRTVTALALDRPPPVIKRRQQSEVVVDEEDTETP